MRTIKKLALWLLALAMLLCLFAGCNGGAQESAAPTEAAHPTEAAASDTPETSEPPSEEPSAEPGTVSLPLTEEPTSFTGWIVAHPMVLNYIENISENSVIAYFAEISNVTFDATMISGAAQTEQFPVMIAGGDYCDIISNVHSLYSGGLSKAWEDEVIIDLAEYGIQGKMPNY